VAKLFDANVFQVCLRQLQQCAPVDVICFEASHKLAKANRLEPPAHICDSPSQYLRHGRGCRFLRTRRGAGCCVIFDFEHDVLNVSDDVFLTCPAVAAAFRPQTLLLTCRQRPLEQLQNKRHGRVLVVPKARLCILRKRFGVGSTADSMCSYRHRGSVEEALQCHVVVLFVLELYGKLLEELCKLTLSARDEPVVITCFDEPKYVLPEPFACAIVLELWERIAERTLLFRIAR